MDKIIENNSYTVLDNIDQLQFEMFEFNNDQYPYIHENKTEIKIDESKKLAKINILLNLDLFVVVQNTEGNYTSIQGISEHKIQNQNDVIYIYVNDKLKDTLDQLSESFRLFYFSEQFVVDQIKKIMLKIMPKNIGTIVEWAFDIDHLGRSLFNIFEKEIFVIVDDIFYKPKIEIVKNRCFYHLKVCSLNESKRVCFEQSIFDIEKEKQQKYFTQSVKQFLSNKKLTQMNEFLQNIHDKFWIKICKKKCQNDDFIQYYNRRLQYILLGDRFCTVIEDSQLRQFLDLVIKKTGSIKDHFPTFCTKVMIEKEFIKKYDEIKKEMKKIYGVKYLIDVYFQKEKLDVEKYLLIQFILIK